MAEAYCENLSLYVRTSKTYGVFVLWRWRNLKITRFQDGWSSPFRRHHWSIIVIDSLELLFPCFRCAKKSKYFQFYFRHKYRRYVAVAVFLFVCFFIFMLILERLGMRTSDVDDPVFDPLLNPNIRINDVNSWFWILIRWRLISSRNRLGIICNRLMWSVSLHSFYISVVVFNYLSISITFSITIH